MNTETDIAWAAGFFDENGSIGISGGELLMQAHASVDPGAPPPMEMQRFASIVGLGRISRRPYSDPRPEHAGRRPRYKWYLRGNACRLAIELLWPELGPRQRTRALEKFARIEGRLES